MKYFGCILVLSGLSLSVVAAPAELSTQTVKADFRHTQVQQLPEATTVVGAEQIDARSAEHLEQILSFAPNVNFSTGSSRGRYYLIRGIGERSQFIDPINPSVGLVIDGIDMTGLGAAATLFDVQQVEILRGPQGTRFGANSLGGLINITSTDPTETNQGYISGKAGNYNSYGLGAAVSGGLASNLQGRIAVNHFQSDGYMENDFLGRKDTNNFNETILRGKLAWQPSDDSELKLTYLFADIDNGFDVFTLDNSRTSLADEPGKDKQETHALALTYQKKINQTVNLETTLSGSANDVLYSYDEDWVFPAFDSNGYTSFDQYEREFNRGSLDLRLLSGTEGRIFNASTDWVIGIYGMGRNERLERNITGESIYDSRLTTNSYSLYSEFSTQLNTNSRLIYGVRLENWKNDFTTSDAVKDNTDEWLFGGKVTLEHMIGMDHLGYVSYARGYKAGGVNSDKNTQVSNRIFETEYNNSYELGLKSAFFDDDLTTRIAMFYIQRLDQQVKVSSAYGLTPVKFQDYIANAAEGRNYGIEVESNWQLTDSLAWELSYGYLNTEFADFSYTNKHGVFIDKTKRQQAHAPEHSASTAIIYNLMPSLLLRIETEAKDEFYFSDSHDEKSKGYVVYHARLSYQKPNFELSLSGRNLGSIDTESRGFYFENDPRTGWNGEKKKYVQLGEPRLVMFEGKYKF